MEPEGIEQLLKQGIRSYSAVSQDHIESSLEKVLAKAADLDEAASAFVLTEGDLDMLAAAGDVYAQFDDDASERGWQPREQ